MRKFRLLAEKELLAVKGAGHPQPTTPKKPVIIKSLLAKECAVVTMVLAMSVSQPVFTAGLNLMFQLHDLI